MESKSIYFMLLTFSVLTHNAYSLQCYECYNCTEVKNEYVVTCPIITTLPTLMPTDPTATDVTVSTPLPTDEPTSATDWGSTFEVASTTDVDSTTEVNPTTDGIPTSEPVNQTADAIYNEEFKVSRVRRSNPSRALELSCVKIVASDGTISRGCSQDLENEDCQKLNVSCYFCDKDKCNSANVMYVTSVIYIPMLVYSLI